MTDLFTTSRSAIMLTTSQVVAMAAGFVAQIAVARILLPAAYGSFAVALSVLVWVEPLVSGGLTLALAQAVSADRRNITDAVRWVKRVFAPYSLVVWAVYSAASNLIASGLGDSSLAMLLLVAGLELPSIALFAAARELLMGVGAAGRQAGVISGHAMLRALTIIAFTAMTQSAVGALAGNALAALAGAIVAVICLRPTISGFQPPAPPISSGDSLPAFVLRSGVPTLLLLLLTQFALTIDLWTVKRLVADSEAVGWYAAGRFFAFVPYMLATGLNLALFPAVCSELGHGNRLKALSLTREAVRILLITLVPLCAVVLVTASPLARLLFSQQFSGAAMPLRVLTIGLSCFAIMGTLQAVIIADRRPMFNCTATGLVGIGVFLLCAGLVPAYGLLGAAWAVTSMGAVGVFALVAYVSQRLGAIVPLATVLRVTIASAGLYVLARLWFVEGPWLLGQYTVFAGLHVILLLCLGEFRRGDFIVARTLIADFWSTLQRRGPSSPE